MESNRFMLECTSICPEPTHQKLESQRVYLTILTTDLYVIFRVNICIHAVHVPDVYVHVCYILFALRMWSHTTLIVQQPAVNGSIITLHRRKRRTSYPSHLPGNNQLLCLLTSPLTGEGEGEREGWRRRGCVHVQ